MSNKISLPSSFFSLNSLLVFLLFVAPTIQYRVELGSFSFALMEPLVLIVSAILLYYQISSRRKLIILKDPLVFLFAAITLWAALIRPWSLDQRHGLSDIRDWVIPLLGFITLITTIRHGWRHWITIYIILVWLSALIGIYQHLTDSFRPFIGELAAYKTGFAISPEEDRLVRASFTAGFFSHPNEFAMYLFTGLMMAIGKYFKHKQMIFLAVFLLPIVLSLYWTFAKAGLLVMAGAILFIWIERRVKPNWTLLVSAIFGIVIGVIILWQVALRVPPALLVTFWWRVGLWQTALEVIRAYPTILIIGNGMDLFALQAYYNQPHNLYIYLLLDYGLIGLIWAFALAWHLWQRGIHIRAAGSMVAEPLLAAMWIGLLGYLVVGLVESNLIGVELRMIFMTATACWTGLAREIKEKIQGEAKPGRAIYVG
jgi:O-antigen ligase